MPANAVRDRSTALRDRMAEKIGNFAIERIASPWYRDRLNLILRYGEIEYVRRLAASRITDTHHDTSAGGRDDG